jgi:hypothetical protein
MAITTLDGYVNSQKASYNWWKTASQTTVATIQFSLFDIAGSPAAGTLAGSNVSAGVVPDDTTTGCQLLDGFGSGANGYLTQVEFTNTVAGRIYLYDLLWKGGAYNAATSNTLSGQPGFLGRCPDGLGEGNQLWLECVTNFTGAQSINIGYTNGQGTTGRLTGVVSTGITPVARRMFRVPLQAGDNGVGKVEIVNSTVATQGTFNVLVLRPLWSGRVRFAHDFDVHGIDRTGMPQIYSNSAIFGTVSMDSTASGIPTVQFEIASG